jgi:hypothetical protein
MTDREFIGAQAAMTDREFITQYLQHWTYDAFEIVEQSGWADVKRVRDGLTIVITAYFNPGRRERPNAELMLIADTLEVPDAWRQIDYNPARLTVNAPTKIYGKTARYKRDEVAGDAYIVFDSPFAISTDLPVLAERAVDTLRAMGVRW